MVNVGVFYYQGGKVTECLLNKENRNITSNSYAFAYVRDFRDFEVDGKKIDSVSNMRYIQTKSCLESNLKDIDFEIEEIR